MASCEPKYTTLLDLARQSKIITGNTACLDGKIQAGLPFSGYPTGVDLTTIVSLGVVSNETAVLSGNSATTVFDVSNPLSPSYNPVFDPYSGTTWSNPLFQLNVSGLTLPITPISALTQTIGPVWSLTQTGMTGDHIIGTEYTGYTILYTFNFLSGVPPYNSISGYTSAIQENFSAGTLDYKGPVDYLRSREDGTIDHRLTTQKLRVTGGASASTIGFVLTQVDEIGSAEWVFNSASASTNTFVTSGLLNISDELILTWNTGGSVPPIDLSALKFTGGPTDCIVDFYVSNIHACSPLNINPLDEGDVFFGSTSGVTIDVINKRLGINISPEWPIDILGSDIRLILDDSGTVKRTMLSGGTTNLIEYTARAPMSGSLTGGVSMGTIPYNGVSPGLVPERGTSGDTYIYSSANANGLNIISQAAAPTQDYIRLYAGQNAAGTTADIHIQGTGGDRGNVGIATESPTQKLHVEGSIRMVDGNEGLDKVLTSDANGVGSWQVLSGDTFTGNTSGDCIEELWVANISGCTGQDLHIGAQDGDIYFDYTGDTSTPNLFIKGDGLIGVGTNTPFSGTWNGTPAGIEIQMPALNDNIALAFSETGSRRFYFVTDFATTFEPVHIYGGAGPSTTPLLTFYTNDSLGVGGGRIGMGTVQPNGSFHISLRGDVADQAKYPDETNIVINNTSTGWTGATSNTPNSSAFRFDHLSSEKPGGLISSERQPEWETGIYSTNLELWNASGGTLQKRIEILASWNTNIYGDIRVIGKTESGGSTNSQFYTDLDFSDGPIVRLTGDTSGLVEINSQSNNQGLSMGCRGTTEPTFVNYGKQGDGFLYSSAEQNGLNVISSNGTGTEDFIKFFAGKTAAPGNIPDIFIMGTGATQGYVGMGTENPEEKLHISGGTIIIEDGSAQTGYSLISIDNKGTAQWAPGFTGGTGSCITDLYVTNIHGCSPVTFHSPLQHIGSSATGLNSIAWGSGNTTNDNFSNILGGVSNTITGNSTGAHYNTIVGGIGNSISDFASATSDSNIIAGGEFNRMTARAQRDAIIGGISNLIGVGVGSVFSSVIVGGTSNVIPGSGITTNSTILGGSGNTINVNNSAIIGGIGISASTDNTVYMNNLVVTQGGALIEYDQNDNTQLRIDNYDGGTHARSGIAMVGSGESGNDSSGILTLLGTGYTGNPGNWQGPYLPNSFSMTTGGGNQTTNAHINIGSRRADGEIRFFSGNVDFDNDTLLGIWNPSGLTLSGDTNTFHFNTDTIQVRNGATTGFVLTATDNLGNAIWEEVSFSGGSGSCITDLYITNRHGCSGSTITEYDPIQHISSSATGVNSIAWGSVTTASGDYSHAEGLGTKATGTTAHAEGQNTLAGGVYSHAEGEDTFASGGGSHAEGFEGISSGSYSHAEGQTTIASNTGSHSEGHSTTASGLYSHAEGRATEAIGFWSHAEGYFTSASGNWSHSSGSGTTASGEGSHAQGLGTLSFGDYSHAEGANTLASGYTSHSEGELTVAGGNWSHAQGQSTEASGDYSHAEGKDTVASGDFSHAEGQNTLASGIMSHAEGLSTSATTDYAHAEGSGTLASGRYSHASGRDSIATGRTSYAEGSATKSFGESSHSEGLSTIASGDVSHAEGKSTIASGSYSHAEGDTTIASGEASHAEGGSTSAIGIRSHAEGKSTIAEGNESHAEGFSTQALGSTSHAGGSQSIASGHTSFVHSTNSLVTGDNSAILGGKDHNIGSGSTNAGIFAGSGNTIDGDFWNSVIVGGDGNKIEIVSGDSCGCPCGFYYNSETGLCTNYTEPLTGSTGLEVGLAGNNVAYGSKGVRFCVPGSYTTCSAAIGQQSSVHFIAGGVSHYGDPVAWEFWGELTLTSGRLNDVGVWTTLPPAGGCTDPPCNEWIGFSRCFTLPSDGQYLFALAGDETVRATIDGVVLVEDPRGSTIINNNFNYWWVWPIEFLAGDHVINLEGMNLGSVAAFGCEIIGPFAADEYTTVTDFYPFSAQTGIDIYTANTVFSSSDVEGGEFDTSDEKCLAGYSYDDCTDMCLTTTACTTDISPNAIVGGCSNEIINSAQYGGILGGCHNIINEAQGTVILGGQNITGVTNDTAYVPHLNINYEPDNSDVLTQVLVRDDSTGRVKYRDASSIAGSFSGNTSGTCIDTLWVSTISGCSPVTIGSSIQSQGSTASGINSFAYGNGVTASGDFSHAEGADNIAMGRGSHAEGGGGGLGTLLNIASGVSSHAEGSDTRASGHTSHAEGQHTIASGTSSHAEGYETTAQGDFSHSEGEATLSSGQASHAEGSGTISFGDSSHAEGNLTSASADNSHAEGTGTEASGNASHAEGRDTTAGPGPASHAEGRDTTASGSGSHSEGRDTVASGTTSHAQGQHTISGGHGSYAGGHGAAGKEILSLGDGSFAHFIIEEAAPASVSVGAHGDFTAILGGRDHDILNTSTDSVIIGGQWNKIDNTVYSSIFGGAFNAITGGTGSSNYNTIVGGLNNSISGLAAGLYNIIAGGNSHLITLNSKGCGIFGGTDNDIDGGIQGVTGSAIIGGSQNNIGSNVGVGSSDNNIILGGAENNMNVSPSHHNNTIINGFRNTISGRVSRNIIVGGQSHNILLSGTDNCVIVGGQTSQIAASVVDSVILGGVDITATASETAFAQNITIVSGGTTSKLILEELPSIAAGNFGTNADGLVTSVPSDSRVKKEVKPLHQVAPPLKFIRQLKGYEFEWTDESRLGRGGDKHYGFMAGDFKDTNLGQGNQSLSSQERSDIEGVGNSMIKLTPDSFYHSGNSWKEKVDLLNYLDIVPWLAEAVKELDNKVDDLNLGDVGVDIFVDRGEYNDVDKTIILTLNDVDSTQIVIPVEDLANTNNYVSNATLLNDILTLEREGLSDLNVNLSSLKYTPEVRKYVETLVIQNNTPTTITHNLNDEYVIVQVRNDVGELIIPDKIHQYQANSVVIEVSITGKYTVIIIK